MALLYRFPGGTPDNDSMREYVLPEGRPFESQQIISIGPQWKGYAGIGPEELSQNAQDRMMNGLVDMTGQNVTGPFTRSEVEEMRPANEPRDDDAQQSDDA